MNIEEILESGKLELYVTGNLTPAEEEEVKQALQQEPSLIKEIEVIEETLIKLGEAASPPLSVRIWTAILDAIRTKNGQSFNWAAVTGWAAVAVCLIGLFWVFSEKSVLQEDFDVVETNNTELRDKLNNAQNEIAINEELLSDLRSKNYKEVLLPGNEAVSPESFVKVFYNQEAKVAYVDAKDLPTPPRGKVYQVWSLVMQPLTPSSMGLLTEDTQIASQLYRFDNVTPAEGFGITLEDEGGSETPTLSQLYTLGTVAQP